MEDTRIIALAEAREIWQDCQHGDFERACRLEKLANTYSLDCAEIDPACTDEGVNGFVIGWLIDNINYLSALCASGDTRYERSLVSCEAELNRRRFASTAA